jgi:hypothetical protein
MRLSASIPPREAGGGGWKTMTRGNMAKMALSSRYLKIVKQHKFTSMVMLKRCPKKKGNKIPPSELRLSPAYLTRVVP